jgi:chromosome segregation protein
LTAPARLLAVRLQGFKSFAERTTVEFAPGISAIVGPNGSGKSNLADALRWALGEQGRSLRIRKAEDVIWAGSDRRAAHGMADVTIVLDNADGLLPVEFGIVELGRRLYRSGENDYLLNRQRVRLRDLVDLLDAANLADNAFLFIGQGMVDQALSLRPEERRPLFEEVAGVRRHERRRRRSEDQLAESLANLARLDDILAELRPQARRLAAQAAQQTSRLSAAEELIEALLASGHARWHEAAKRLAAARAAREEARRDVDQVIVELAAADELAASIATELEARAAEERSLRAAHERALGTRTAAELRRERLTAEADSLRRDRERLIAERAAALAALETARSLLGAPRPPRDVELEAALSEAERDLAEAAAEVAALRAADRARDDGLAALRRAEAARAAELETARRRIAEAERRWETEASAEARAGERVVMLEQAAAAARAALEAAAAAEQAAVERRETARHLLEAAEARGAAAREIADSRSAAAGARRSRLEALRAQVADEASRGLARAARRLGGRQLAEDLVVDPGLRAAIAAALTHLSGAWVVTRSVVGQLGGERGVLVVEPGREAPAARGDRGVQDRERRLLDLVAATGGGPLVGAVRRDPLGAVSRLLARAAWLPDLDACLEIQPALPPGWVVVPRDGSAVVGELRVELGAPDGLLERQAEMERLSAETGRLEAEAREATAELEKALEAAATARLALREAGGLDAASAAERRRLEEAERRAGRDLESAVREAGWHRDQAARVGAELARSRETLARLETASPAARPGRDSDPAAAPGESPGESPGEPPVEPARSAWEVRAVELQARRDGLARQVASAELTRREAETDRSRAEATVALREERLAAIGADLEAIGGRSRDNELALADVVRDVAEGGAREVAARAAVQRVVAAGGAERDRLAAAEGSSAAARERLRAVDEAAHAAERAALEAELGLEAIREQLLADLAALGETAAAALGARMSEAAIPADGPSMEPPAPAEPSVTDASGPSFEAALMALTDTWTAEPPHAEPPSPARIAGLRRRFHELGAANPFAVDEHQALQARLGQLESQRADLLVAVERTRRLIDELSTLITEQFQSTFRALEAAFDHRFQQLFGGGFARLELTDPLDPGSTGIEISARPPGKKRQPLAMLSGGERSLTAVALLLAMLQVRPVPFCVLDEVDAALDEANVGRFTTALRELAESTQFVVITHNRGTIGAADALYGVTVADDSVSRVISLRLDGPPAGGSAVGPEALATSTSPAG